MRSVDVNLPRKPLKWPRGGRWDIVWVPADEQIVSDVEREEYDGAWMYVDSGRPDMPGQQLFAHASSSGTAVYDPMVEEPLLYAKFAQLGKSVWRAYEGVYLSERSLGEDVPRGLRQKAKDFIERNGPPVVLQQAWYEEGEFWSASLHTMLREAQLVAVAVSYLRVARYEEEPIALTRYVDSIVNRLQLEGSRWLPFDPEYLHEHRGDLLRISREGWQDLLLRNDLRTRSGVLALTEWFISSWQLDELRLGGVKLEPELLSVDDEAVSEWKSVLRYNNLYGLLWYQVHRALVERSVLRTCKNERCARKGLPFKPSRPDQRFCGKHCRDAYGARERRRGGWTRDKDEAIGGILP